MPAPLVLDQVQTAEEGTHENNTYWQLDLHLDVQHTTDCILLNQAQVVGQLYPVVKLLQSLTPPIQYLLGGTAFYHSSLPWGHVMHQ